MLLAIGRPHEVAHGSLRLTLDRDTSAEDVETIIRVTKDVVARLRAMSPVWRDLIAGKRQFVIE